MLENNFNELDNDFVTLWSKYLVSGNLNLEILTKLAELGQVNAIQSYYLCEDEELMFPNNTIAKQCEKLPNDFNGRYAKVCSEYFILHGNNPKATDLFLNQNLGELTKAITLAKIDYEENGNALSGERYLEMLYSISELNLDEQALQQMSALAVQIREELEKGYERLGEPQYAFALGKNLLFFGETEEEQKGGKYLLSELTHREYSKKLNNYKTTFDRLKEFADDNGGYHII